MDHVSATAGLPTSERINISGARVFDGEDQGKITPIFSFFFSTFIEPLNFRCRKQIPNATVTAIGLVRVANPREVDAQGEREVNSRALRYAGSCIPPDSGQHPVGAQPVENSQRKGKRPRQQGSGAVKKGARDLAAQDLGGAGIS